MSSLQSSTLRSTHQAPRVDNEINHLGPNISAFDSKVLIDRFRDDAKVTDRFPTKKFAICNVLTNCLKENSISDFSAVIQLFKYQIEALDYVDGVKKLDTSLKLLLDIVNNNEDDIRYVFSSLIFLCPHELIYSICSDDVIATIMAQLFPLSDG